MTYTGQTDARRKANSKYLKETVDSVMTRTPKGVKAELQALAEKHEMSLNSLMNRAIEYLLAHPDILINTDCDGKSPD